MKKIKLKDLIKLTKPPIHLLVFGLILSIVSALAGLIMPLMAKDVIENISNGISGTLVITIVIMLATWIVCSILSIYLLQYAGIKVVKDLRSKLWKKLLNLPVRYYDKEHSGQLISRVTNDTTVLKELVSFRLTEFVTNIITIVGAVVILFLIDVPMTLVLLISVPVIVLIVMPVGGKLYKIALDEEKEMADLSGLLSQTLSEIRLIKAYGAEKKEFDRGEENFKNLFKYGIKTAKIQSILAPLIMIFAMIVFIFVISFGAYRVSTGAVSSGDLVAFLLYLFQIVFPIASMGDFFSSVQKTKGATAYLYTILMEDEEDINSGVHIEDIEEISFKDIVYSYDTKKVLDEVSFSAKKGETVARAILRNPSILLFDEATASLDTESEKIIQESVNKVKDGKIVFVIAHRLSTVVDSDKILVMQEGKISGIGTHQELLSSHEFYRNLVNQQFVDNNSDLQEEEVNY